MGDTLTRTVKCAASGVSATGMARANAGSTAGAEAEEVDEEAAARKEAGADSRGLPRLTLVGLAQLDLTM